MSTTLNYLRTLERLENDVREGLANLKFWREVLDFNERHGLQTDNALGHISWIRQRIRNDIRAIRAL